MALQSIIFRYCEPSASEQDAHLPGGEGVGSDDRPVVFRVHGKPISHQALVQCLEQNSNHSKPSAGWIVRRCEDWLGSAWLLFLRRSRHWQPRLCLRWSECEFAFVILLRTRNCGSCKAFFSGCAFLNIAFVHQLSLPLSFVVFDCFSFLVIFRWKWCSHANVALQGQSWVGRRVGVGEIACCGRNGVIWKLSNVYVVLSVCFIICWNKSRTKHELDVQCFSNCLHL